MFRHLSKPLQLDPYHAIVDYSGSIVKLMVGSDLEYLSCRYCDVISPVAIALPTSPATDFHEWANHQL